MADSAQKCFTTRPTNNVRVTVKLNNAAEAAPNDGGRILNISSGLARVSLPGSSVYGAAKGAFEVLTRYLATELGPHGMTASVVAPGAIQTVFSGVMVRGNSRVNKMAANMVRLLGIP